MKDKDIKLAQDYLTVNYDDRTHQIVNADLLLKRHGPDDVIDFLENLKNEYSRKLKKLIRKNKSDPRLNDIVARRFRIQMAINTIRNSGKRRKKAA